MNPIRTALVAAAAAACVSAAPAAAAGDPAKSVVVVRQDDVAPGSLSAEKPSLGAGVIVAVADTRLTILTAKHVVSKGRLSVTLPNGDTYPVSAKTLAANDDVAVISVSVSREDSGTVVAAPLATEYAVGETVTIVGHPNANLWRRLDGTITYETRDPGFITACADCTFGVSGGGVFDTEGRLLGIVYGLGPVFTERHESLENGRSFTFSTSVAALRTIFPKPLTDAAAPQVRP